MSDIIVKAVDEFFRKARGKKQSRQLWGELQSLQEMFFLEKQNFFYETQGKER